ncbi:Flowering locus K homology domain [Zea mays]|uniref:Flowering locus K homology domain n=1 Tax=Zea mays TaxID=4577 RepID=A0A1D6GQN5_MAIZE|nr:Flowering locus K homology domain [Zea mays]
MAHMQSSPKGQEVHEVTRKSNDQIVLKQDTVDDEDSGDTTSSAGESKYPGWPGTTVFRMLIPAQKVGAIIGHKGERVRRLCEETRACVRIIGGHLCAAEQAVIIFGREQLDEPLPPAMDALLRVYQQTINNDSLDVGPDNVIVRRILAPSEQAASLIGEHGVMINSIMEASQTDIRVLDDDLPPVALEEDRVIEIWGSPAGVYKALELVASHLRKYLVDRSVIPLFDRYVSCRLLFEAFVIQFQWINCYIEEITQWMGSIARCLQFGVSFMLLVGSCPLTLVSFALVPMPILHMDMPPCHYIDYPEGPVHPVSPGYHSVSTENLQHERWIGTSYLRGRHPMGNLRHADTFEYRWEAPTPFRRYRSVTPPNHAISAYGPEASSPTEAYLSAPMKSRSHHSLINGWHASPVSSTDSDERICSLISVYGQQAQLQKQTCQSAKLGKNPQFGISLHGSESEAHPTRVSPSDSTEQPPSPCFRIHPPTTVENLLHCRVSACGPEASLPLHLAVTSSTSRSTVVASQVKKKMQVPIFYAEAVIGPTGERIEYIRRTSRSSILISNSEGTMYIEITGSAATDVLTAEQLIKNFMAEAAAASPGHSYDFIPSYLPAPRSAQADIFASPETSEVSSLPERRLQMIY